MTPKTYTDYVVLNKGDTPPPDPHAANVRVYADTDGALRSIQSDGTDAAVGGGGSSPASAVYSSSHNTSVGNGATESLGWDIDSGTPLLDLTDEFAPTVLEDGFYVVSAEFAPFPITVGGFYIATLTLDSEVGDAQITVDSPPSTAAWSDPRVSITLSSYIPAGHTILAQVENDDGANAVNFRIKNATILKV